MALLVGVDTNLAVSLVKQENAGMNVYLISTTRDVGLMQLNIEYLDYFVESYWDQEQVFDWTNAWHNLYVGLKHLKRLVTTYGLRDGLICYNAGENWILRGRAPPDSSVIYAYNIMRRAGL
jgi:hypothetical protein